ncbi:sulfite exporter TauE/SafE family protein [Photobacterium sanctipauli]|uniref:Probable membrane transporter protein n=1 Tax=Photobacterium sanctipauli TaxID=1342794 RepID=A0A2T3NWB5_9GAMM|nr:sulfite exporter TauE/SafE family protein [Photobacterium sanctipauli]PSW20583.1 sulfite exporter TauE/SafE family protein [Photobacterium sanctipauli]
MLIPSLDIIYILAPIISLVAALVSSLAGFGGGIVMLILLSPLIPTKELMAVICLVQFASLISRVLIYRNHISTRFMLEFMVGAIPATIIASLVFDQINAASLAVILGLFLLYSAIKPNGLPFGKLGNNTPFSGGVLSFISFFVGAPGPGIAALLQRLEFDKFTFLGTITACMLMQNVFKLTAFISIGVPMEKWIVICLIMSATGIIGTIIGKKLGNVISEVMIFRFIRIAMLLASLNLFYKAMSI